jgi:hypothetical protein
MSFAFRPDCQVPRSSPAFGEKGRDGFDVLLVSENLRRENFKFEISDG